MSAYDEKFRPLRSEACNGGASATALVMSASGSVSEHDTEGYSGGRSGN